MINIKNDQMMDKHAIEAILKKYQTLFPAVKILNQPHVNKFLFDCQCQYIDGDKRHNVTVSFFDGMLIVHHKQDVHRFLNFDDHSFVKSLMDRKYYSSVFIIYGQEGGLVFCSKEK